MLEREIDLTTPDGEMKTFIFHPEHDGPHPVVLYLMDAPSIRPALMDMARRLASAGYYVMMPYLFYRGGPFRVFGLEDSEMHERRELMGSVTPTNVLADADALLAEAASDPNAGDGPVGAVGFCMSGGLGLAIAKANPDRVTAVASLHGAFLIRDTDDSPHLGLEAANAEVYLGWADKDDTAPPEQVSMMEAVLTEAGLTYTLDFFEDAVHGYAPAGPRHDLYASELHWERVHALFRRNLPR
jgi:carboxymethylenebutenolidase